MTLVLKDGVGSGAASDPKERHLSKQYSRSESLKYHGLGFILEFLQFTTPLEKCNVTKLA